MRSAAPPYHAEADPSADHDPSQTFDALNAPDPLVIWSPNPGDTVSAAVTGGRGAAQLLIPLGERAAVIAGDVPVAGAGLVRGFWAPPRGPARRPARPRAERGWTLTPRRCRTAAARSAGRRPGSAASSSSSRSTTWPVSLWPPLAGTRPASPRSRSAVLAVAPPWPQLSQDDYAVLFSEIHRATPSIIQESPQSSGH
jgi:hypothetical protein